MVTIDDVRGVAVSLPWADETLVRDGVKVRSAGIVYFAFSRNETLMGSHFRGMSVRH